MMNVSASSHLQHKYDTLRITFHMFSTVWDENRIDFSKSNLFFHESIGKPNELLLLLNSFKKMTYFICLSKFLSEIIK